ncbi:unnamed protein product [marine sediment metagenome]|uniref:Uncharacterized protein n=1 Tax=marine sediment metagenome TaxID=412755 RepID=X0X522_9ZZZZ
MGTFNADAIVKANASASFSADAFVAARAFTADAFIVVERWTHDILLDHHGAESDLFVVLSSPIGPWVEGTPIHYVMVDINERLISLESSTKIRAGFTADAVIVGLSGVAFTADAVVLGSRSAGFTVDAILIAGGFLTADAWIQAGFTADAFIVADF